MKLFEIQGTPEALDGVVALLESVLPRRQFNLIHRVGHSILWLRGRAGELGQGIVLGMSKAPGLVSPFTDHGWKMVSARPSEIPTLPKRPKECHNCGETDMLVEQDDGRWCCRGCGEYQ